MHLKIGSVVKLSRYFDPAVDLTATFTAHSPVAATVRELILTVTARSSIETTLVKPTPSPKCPQRRITKERTRSIRQFAWVIETASSIELISAQHWRTTKRAKCCAQELKLGFATETIDSE